MPTMDQRLEEHIQLLMAARVNAILAEDSFFKLYVMGALKESIPEVVHETDKDEVLLNVARDFKNEEGALVALVEMMKLDNDVSAVDNEVPDLFRHACEMFVLQIIQKSLEYVEEEKKKILETDDIVKAICNFDPFNFLVFLLTERENL